MAEAARHVGNPPLTFRDFREKLRRAVESHTFSIRAGGGGIQIVDAPSAGFGSFDLVIAVGLNEGEWPSRGDRNIFYPQRLLKDFGWPTDAETLFYERAAFVELLRLSTSHVAVLRHQLEEEIPTVASPFLEEVEAVTGHRRAADPTGEFAGLIISRSEALRAGRIPVDERLRRTVRQPGLVSRPSFDPEPVSATAFELYLRCPFKYFSRYVLGLEEEDDIMEGLNPLERGRILHDILQKGFELWDARSIGPRPITRENYDEALRLFRNVAVKRLPPRARSIEMERLFGGPGEKGAIEWLLRMEMSRGPLRKRLLEHAFQNQFQLEEGPEGEAPWFVRIKGRSDRIDIDHEGYLHLFDYKSGRAPESRITIQVPLYALCLSQEYSSETVEAVYLSLRDKRSVTRDDFRGAVAKVRETFLGIREGRFPPRPYQDHLCASCGYQNLCRKQIESS